MATRAGDRDSGTSPADGRLRLAIAAKPTDLEAAQDVVIAVLSPMGAGSCARLASGFREIDGLRVALAAATTVALSFLLIPIVAIFAELSLGEPPPGSPAMWLSTPCESRSRRISRRWH